MITGYINHTKTQEPKDELQILFESGSQEQISEALVEMFRTPEIKKDIINTPEVQDTPDIYKEKFDLDRLARAVAQAET